MQTERREIERKRERESERERERERERREREKEREGERRRDSLPCLLLDRVVKTIFTTSVLNASMMMPLVLPKQKETKETLSLPLFLSLSLASHKEEHRRNQKSTATTPTTSRILQSGCPQFASNLQFIFCFPSSKHKART